jgi:hypothetical protein
MMRIQLAVALMLGLTALARAQTPTPPDDGPTKTAGPEQKPEPPPPEPRIFEDSVNTGEVLMVSGTTHGRGVAEEFLVLPDGAQVEARLRLLTADPRLQMEEIKLTDVALFDLSAAWAFARHFELDASISLLPKQASTTNEPIIQGGTLALRRDLVPRTALAVALAARPLFGVDGLAFGGDVFFAYRHRLNEIATFALAGGASTTLLRPSDGIDDPYLIEAAGHVTVQVRCPEGFCAGWMGAGYAVPVYDHGHEPVGGMRLDSQPRLDLELGASVQLAKNWDLAVSLSIIDRGDLANAATHLPVLDGGFDQVQLGISIGRRLTKSSARGTSDPLIQL